MVMMMDCASEIPSERARVILKGSGKSGTEGCTVTASQDVGSETKLSEGNVLTQAGAHRTDVTHHISCSLTPTSLVQVDGRGGVP